MHTDRFCMLRGGYASITQGEARQKLALSPCSGLFFFFFLFFPDPSRVSSFYYAQISYLICPTFQPHPLLGETRVSNPNLLLDLHSILLILPSLPTQYLTGRLKLPWMHGCGWETCYIFAYCGSSLKSPLSC